MNEIGKRGLRLNAVTGPQLHAPAVSPDTLKELVNPYYGFLQTYSLIGDSSTWHGQLKNIGMQYSIPFSILLPPRVTEMLQLNNDDTIILKPCLLSEARTIHYKKLAGEADLLDRLPELQLGMEIGDPTQYLLGGVAIELLQWAPEGCFFGPGTEMIETQSQPGLTFTPENQACEVVTDIDNNNNLTQENNENDSTN